MLTMDALQAYGANTQEGLGRCLNNEAFYLRLVNMAVKDANFQKLHDALTQGDLDAGFEAAHALKGVLGNLALSPLLAPIGEVTELLRARTPTDYAPYRDAIDQKYAELAALCAN